MARYRSTCSRSAQRRVLRKIPLILNSYNLVFGAVIGVLFCIIDFYVRDQILSHRQIFEAQPVRNGNSTAHSQSQQHSFAHCCAVGKWDMGKRCFQEGRSISGSALPTIPAHIYREFGRGLIPK
jgi:hypothetical protein